VTNHVGPMQFQLIRGNAGLAIYYHRPQDMNYVQCRICGLCWPIILEGFSMISCHCWQKRFNQERIVNR
jgi:hypothetical protein